MTIVYGHYDGRRVVLDDLARLAGPDDLLPTDYAEQHEHYVKGTPRRT